MADRGIDTRRLGTLWDDCWPRCEPIGHLLRGAYRERWVRVHSLPESKRYPDTEAEYRIVLDRHRAVLGELGSSGELVVIHPHWGSADLASSHEQSPRFPRASFWRSVNQDPDDQTTQDVDLFVALASPDSDALAGLLRDVADDSTAWVIIAPRDFRWLYAPYDGGGDVIASTTQERDLLGAKFASWLPTLNEVEIRGLYLEILLLASRLETADACHAKQLKDAITHGSAHAKILEALRPSLAAVAQSRSAWAARAREVLEHLERWPR